jgi:hypothetical protein
MTPTGNLKLIQTKQELQQLLFFYSLRKAGDGLTLDLR